MKILLFKIVFLLALAQQANALVVLQYHHVSNETPKITSISPELFAQHMAYLKENKFDVWSMETLVDALSNGKDLPNKTAVITFDDGYISIYEQAWPLLKRYNYPFTIFVNTQHHDKPSKQFMSWDQLKTLSDQGVTIGNHSESHSYMVRRLENESQKQWRARVESEISDAQKNIDAKVGKQPKVFAYPYGEYNLELKGILKARDYIAFGQQSGAVSPSDHLQILPRFPFGGEYGDNEDFKIKVESIPFPFFKESFFDEKNKPFNAPILPKDTTRPILKLELGDAQLAAKIQCFGSGVGALPVQREDGAKEIMIQAQKSLKGERARYNCTAPFKSGVFYWYSTTFIFPQ